MPLLADRHGEQFETLSSQPQDVISLGRHRWPPRRSIRSYQYGLALTSAG